MRVTRPLPDPWNLAVPQRWPKVLGSLLCSWKWPLAAVTGGGGDNRATHPWEQLLVVAAQPSSIPGYFPCPFSLMDPEPPSAPHAGAGEGGRGRWGALTFNSEEDLGIYAEMEFKNSCPGANRLQPGAWECWCVPGMGRIYTSGVGYSCFWKGIWHLFRLSGAGPSLLLTFCFPCLGE